MSNVEFFNLDVRVLSSQCASWNTIAFEIQGTNVTNTVLRDSRFNRTVSLGDSGGGSPLASGYRWRIHNNHFATATDSYAIELNFHSCEIDHNFFQGGGGYPIASFTSERKKGNRIHHNVVDISSGPTAFLHITAGVMAHRVYNNTIVMRAPSWRDGMLSFAEMGFHDSTVEVRNNILFSTTHIGDKIGLGLGSAIIDRNSFHNLVPRGSNATIGSPELPLTGGFPIAYLPPVTNPAARLGAFADGTWQVGPLAAVRS